VAKMKAPRWLTTSFAEGVHELAPARPAPAYKGALGRCWLAQFDDRKRPCGGRFELAHLIPRQRVENALGALLPYAGTTAAAPPGVIGEVFSVSDRRDLILLAAWDPRNGGIACEGMHRRFDSHATPTLIVPRSGLPDHVEEFAADWGLESELERKFS
jgi:hypothetical protein